MFDLLEIDTLGGNFLDDDNFLSDWGDFLPSAEEILQSAIPSAIPLARSVLHAQPDWQGWSANPFDLHQAPFGSLLEPAGYAAIRAMKCPNTKSYAQLMPKTYAAAVDIFDAVGNKHVWGEHGYYKGNLPTWKTRTDGRWHQTKSGKQFPDKTISLLNVIKSLAHPESYSLANVDKFTSNYARAQHIRIDIDMDLVFQDDDLSSLQREIKLCRAIFTKFGLNAYIMRTGNRGIQAIAPIPAMHRRFAMLLAECIRTVLSHTRRTWRAEDFQTNFDGLMRLPLGRHAFTESVSWYLGEDAAVLPLDRQIEALSDSLHGSSGHCDDWCAEAEIWLSSHGAGEPNDSVTAEMMTGFEGDCPDNSLAVMFRAAWAEFCGGKESLVKEVSIDIPAELERVLPAPAETVESEHNSAPKPKKIRVGKGWANDVISAGFQPGNFWNWSRSDGKNGIGAAIVVCDGNRATAEALLIKMAQSTACRSAADMQRRIDWIKWAVPRNNIDLHHGDKNLAKSRALPGTVTAEDTASAERFTQKLVQARKSSDMRRKVFAADSLTTIKHIVELMLMALRDSGNAPVRMSERTLADEISQRWPEHATCRNEIKRQLEWIKAGSNKCLHEALVTVFENRGSYDANSYVMGVDLSLELDFSLGADFSLG